VSPTCRWLRNRARPWPGGSLDADAVSVDWAPPPYGRWRLVQRTLLNPGSPGAPAFHLAFEPLDAAASTWRAGDIAQVGVPQADGALPLQREYSIASLPEAGRVELLVRQVRRSCGALGLGSGWLTAHAPVGAEVPLRVRENRSFHAPEDARPLILIGNGTGIAGLRAHLHARARAGHQRNWLLFGERTAQHDFFFRAEIEAWRETGILERVDLAFSRDQTARRYVQHLVAAAAAEVRAWVSAGAAVYVCGSLQGMAAGVSEALAEALGAEAVARLIEEGRYRRDVY
jgi:sulfite reductase (NADPH) flavoprotein alpha-component